MTTLTDICREGVGGGATLRLFFFFWALRALMWPLMALHATSRPCMYISPTLHPIILYFFFKKK